MPCRTTAPCQVSQGLFSAVSGSDDSKIKIMVDKSQINADFILGYVFGS